MRNVYKSDPGSLDFIPFVDTPEGEPEKPAWADDPEPSWSGS